MSFRVNIKTFQFPFALTGPKNWGGQRKVSLSCLPAHSYILLLFPTWLLQLKCARQQQLFVLINLF